MMQSNPVILVIEDDPQIRRFLRTGLRAYGFDIYEAETGKFGATLAASRKPDLIILDLGLPDMDGIEVLKSLRQWTTRPIIVLSARTLESDKVGALNIGADDYLTKPFGLEELVARIRASIRRYAQSVRPDSGDNVFKSGDLIIDLVRRRVQSGGQEVQLTPIEFRLLVTLARHGGKVLTHEHLLNDVWGPKHVKNNHYLRVYMKALRQKLEVDPAQPKLLLTEMGIGYRLATESG
jgi:two-component system, OmpR family, KDP operon response regulator KdpE